MVWSRRGDYEDRDRLEGEMEDWLDRQKRELIREGWTRLQSQWKLDKSSQVKSRAPTVVMDGGEALLRSVAAAGKAHDWQLQVGGHGLEKDDKK